MAHRADRHVVVITGASSGIGRETALRLAKKGSTLVLAARREEALEELRRQCEDKGADCLVVPTDVAEAHEVDALADAAFRTFGRIDGWVNNAGVYLMGSLEETPLAAYRQVMDTNYFGVVHGTRAALRYMKRQPDGGVIVNMSSQLGSVSGPYLSAYCASKHAIRGFSHAVRQELLDTPVRVSVVMPASIDTPLFEHSANYTGQQLRAADPVYSPDKVAKQIIRLLDHPKAESYVGGLNAPLMGAMRHAAPGAFDRMMRRQTDSGHFRDEHARRTPGNLYRPVQHGTGSRGGHKGRTKQWGRRLGLLGLFGIGAGAAQLLRNKLGGQEGPRRLSSELKPTRATYIPRPEVERGPVVESAGVIVTETRVDQPPA